MDKPKIEKMLWLVRHMSKKNSFSIDELAEMMGTSPRTVYRYIDTLRESGFVVEKVYGNVFRLLKMPAQFRDFDKLVYFSEEEVRILKNLIQSLETTNTLKAGIGKKLAAVCESSDIGNFIVHREYAEVVESLSSAIKNKKAVILRQYASANSDRTRDRKVEPFSFTTNFIDVWAYDVEDGINKLFKIARIGSVDVESDWKHEDEHHAGFLDIFRMSSFSQSHVKLELSLRAKNLLCEEYPLAPSEVHQEDGKWFLDTMVSSMEGVGRFVAGLATEVKIIDSPELSEYVQDYLTKALTIQNN